MKTKISSVVGAIGSLLLLISSSSATYASTASIITIFDDFGPGNSYQGGQAAPVAGSDSVFGVARTFAMPFTSFYAANVTQIDLGLSIIGGYSAATDALTVSLDINDGGTLGRTLRSWSLSDLNLLQFGSTSNSVTTISDIKGVHLKAGDSYYLLMAPADPTTAVAWNINTVGTIGTRLIDGQPQVADLSAFRILGTPTPPNQNLAEAALLTAPVVTPLPTALPLFATGLGVLGLLGWRRKRKQAA